MLDRGLTVAVAESLTGGLVSAALSATAGSSATFRGGLVVYATDLKALLAGVAQPLLDAQGPVNADVATALARGVRENLGSDLGVGITGVAGPEPVGDYEPGTVFLAVAGADFDSVTRAELSGSRAEIRSASVSAALNLLLSTLVPAHESGMPEGSPGVTP